MLLVSLLGALVGFVLGVWFIRVSAARKHTNRPAASAPPPNRRARAAAMLSDMRKAEEVMPSPNQSDANARTDVPASAASHSEEQDEEDWEDESEEDQEEEESEVDEEYERIEALRLKLVLVVLHGDVKLPAQDVALLVSSAAVFQIERILGAASADAETAGSSLLVSGASDGSPSQASQWKEWYAGWNLVGCAKITLKTPQEASLQSVFDGARASGLPCCMLRQSYLQSMKVSCESEAAAGEGGASGKGKKKKRAAASPEVAQSSSGHNVDMNSMDPYVVVALGPAPADNLDPFTGSLKLFS